MIYKTIIFDLFKRVPWYYSFYKDHGEVENIELPYTVITYLLDYYYKTEKQDVRCIIEDTISDMLISKDKNLKDLVLSGFFEAHGFDSRNKYIDFYEKLSQSAKKYVDSIDDFWDSK